MKKAINAKMLSWCMAALILIGLVNMPLKAAGLASWISVSSNATGDLSGLWGDDASRVFAVGKSGTILQFDGANWSSMNSGSTRDLSAIWGIDSRNVFAVGSAGTALRYSGVAWNPVNSDNTTDLLGVWGTDTGNMLAVGKSGIIERYDGLTWSSLTSGVTNDLNAVWGRGSANVFAVGKAGTILHFDNTAWSAMSSGTTSDLYAVRGFEDGSVYAVGQSGTVLRYNGSVWISLTSGVNADLYGIWGPFSGTVFMVGAAGTIVRYDGVTFSSMSRDTIRDLRSVWGSSASDVWTAGNSGSLLHYFPPSINSMTPTLGDQGQNLDITISGSNLTGTSGVRLGAGIAVNSFKIMSSNQIAANITIVAGAPTGAGDVSVTTPGGSFVLPGGFSVNQAVPTISAVSPGLERQGVNLKLTITGTYLSGGSLVSLGPGIAVNSFSVTSANQIAADITIAADAAPGTRDVTVNAAGGKVVLPGGFIVRQALPTLTSISPGQGNQETTLTLTINGTNLTGASQPDLGDGVVVNSYAVPGPNQIVVSISISGEAVPGARDVAVVTPGGKFILPGSFVVKQALPILTGILPASGSQGATLNVTLRGANLNGTTEVRLGTGVAVNNFNVVSTSQIEAVITILSGTETGPRDASVTTPGGSFVLPAGFSVDRSLPVVTSVSPESGNQGASVTVIISGSNLDSASSVSFGAGVAVQSFTNLSPTQLRVNVVIDQDAATGLRDVTVTTAGGSSTLGNRFTIKQRSLSVLILVLIWIGIALVVGLFVLVLNLLRKRRAARL